MLNMAFLFFCDILYYSIKCEFMYINLYYF